MKKQIVTAIAIGITGTFPAIAQESPAQQPASITPDALFELPTSQVVNTKYENGRLVFCNIVGTAVIRTSLGVEAGTQMAAEKAKANARAAFVEWIKVNARSITTTSDEAIVNVKGQGDESGESTTEEGKMEEKFKREVSTKAEGLVRGMDGVGSRQVGNRMVCLFKWSSKSFNAATNLEQDSKASEFGATMPSTSSGGSKRKSGVEEKTTILPGWDQP